MIIEYNKTAASYRCQHVNAVEVGTVFSGTLGAVTGLFLRIFAGVVLLNNPSKTWSWSSADGPRIDDYRERTVRIVVED